jgi:hypothetical protein
VRLRGVACLTFLERWEVGRNLDYPFAITYASVVATALRKRIR